MKQLILTSALVLASVMASEANAVCSNNGTQVKDTATGTRETASITFKDLQVGESVTVAGLTFTASVFKTANSIRQAFRSLPNLATTGLGTGGVYSGTFTGWTSANTASGANLVFTSVNFGNVLNIITSTTGPALTVSTTNGTGVPALSTLLTGNTVCVGTPPSTWEAQEYHKSPGGDLIDYKKGPSDPVDPTSSVGSWSISGTGTSTAVTYVYDTSYIDKVWDLGNGSYNFCDGTHETHAVYIKPGQVGC